MEARLWPLLWFLILSFSSVASAQVVEKINARLLPTVWYSSLDVSAGEKIKVYAGFQNNSGTNVSGTAIFYVNDAEFAKKPFNAASESLTLLSAEWPVTEGKHLIRVKVTAQLPEGKTLVSSESERVTLDISKPLTLPEAVEKGEEVLSVVTAGVDSVAEVLASKLESFKKPLNSESVKPANKSLLSQTSPNAQQDQSDIVQDALMASVLNSGIDVASFLVRHWIWTLGGIFVLYLLFKFR